MKNDTRSNVHHRHTALCLALSAALFAAPVRAEVGLPPPAQHQGAGFPSEQALRQKGYDPKTGVWRVQSQNNGKPTVTKDGGTIKGTQGKTITVTGKYGEKGVIKTTQTQSVSSSKLQTAVNGLWIGSAVSNSVERFGPVMGSRIRAGDYKGAFESAVLMAGDIGNGLTFGIPKSLGSLGGYLGINPSPQEFREAGERFYQWQMQKEKGGDLGGAIAAAAAKRAAEEAAKAKNVQQQQNAREKGQDAGIWITSVGPSYGSTPQEACSGPVPGMPGASYKFSPPLSCLGVMGNNVWLWGLDYVSKLDNQSYQQSVINKMRLNQEDIKDILSRMLNNQQTNHAELMNQLSRIGDAVEKSTESNQFTPMTADSAPYTPQGSNTPQQTRFTINRDGSITTTIIPRPDLKPNSTLAPTRSEIIPTPNKGQNTPTTPNSPNTPTTPDSPNAPTTQNSPNTPNTPNTPNNPTGQQNQNQENQKQDFCQQNPNAAQCMQGGDASYEDIVLPENTIDLDFRPENVFQTEGVCPQPKSVDLGAFGQVEFSYQPLCDFAAKLRPVLIMMTILTCAWFVYGALEEL